MFSHMLKGLIVGLSVAAPIGPIGVLCIRRTLLQGQLPGFISGLGAATAHALYGMISVFGISMISRFLLGNIHWVHLIGGGYLCYLGTKLIFKPNIQVKPLSDKNNLWKNYCSSLFLTLTNPMTLLSFSAMFTGVGVLKQHGSFTTNSIIIFGVFLSSALWWLSLSSFISFFRHKMSPHLLLWFNHISGIGIILFGSYFIL